MDKNGNLLLLLLLSVFNHFSPTANAIVADIVAEKLFSILHKFIKQTMSTCFGCCCCCCSCLPLALTADCNNLIKWPMVDCWAVTVDTSCILCARAFYCGQGPASALSFTVSKTSNFMNIHIYIHMCRIHTLRQFIVHSWQSFSYHLLKCEGNSVWYLLLPLNGMRSWKVCKHLLLPKYFPEDLSF